MRGTGEVTEGWERERRDDGHGDGDGDGEGGREGEEQQGSRHQARQTHARYAAGRSSCQESEEPIQPRIRHH